jgi:hypothetical protein
MSIPTEILEPGGVYESRSGQRREIVSIHNTDLIFRVVAHGPMPINRQLEIGETAQCKGYVFARWAQREVA